MCNCNPPYGDTPVYFVSSMRTCHHQQPSDIGNFSVCDKCHEVSFYKKDVGILVSTGMEVVDDGTNDYDE